MIGLHFHQCLTVNKHFFSSKGNLQIPSIQTTLYEKNDLVYMVMKTCNGVQKEMKGVMLNTFSLVKIKSLLI